MKKIYLLLFLMPFTKITSAQIYTVGTGTGNNVNTTTPTEAIFPCPYNNQEAVVRNQFLILASELIAAGAPGGGGIRSVGFDVARINVVNNTLSTFTVSIGQTGLSSLTGFVAGLTSVYSQNFTPTAGWDTHNFNTCFVWDGVSNIIVETCYTKGKPSQLGQYGGAETYWTTGLGFNASVYDSTASCGQSNTPVKSTNRPNMQFGIVPKLDAYVASLNTPALIVTQGTPFSVSINIGNIACSGNITSANLGYSWGGAAIPNVAWAGTLAPLSTLSYTFATGITPNTPGSYILKTWIKNPNGINPDGNPANDTLTTTIYVMPNTPFDSTTYFGKNFWVAYMQNWDNLSTTLWLYFVTGSQAATIKVYAPLLQGAALTTITVPAFNVAWYNVPLVINNDTMATRNLSDESVSLTGVEVTSTTPISVYGLNTYPGSTDGFLAIPTPALGTSYVVAAQEGEAPGGGNINAPAEFIVVATQANTTVTINALQATVSHAANTAWNVTLAKAGDTYLVQAKVSGSFGNDLTGSLITSDKPVAVFGGASCADMPGDASPGTCNNCNHLIEETPPSAAWAMNYYAGHFAVKTGPDLLRIISNSAGTTSVMVNGTPYSLNNRTYTEIQLPFNTGAQITSDQPIYVIQEATGGQCDDTPSDPMYINLIPEEQWGQFYLFTTAVLPTGSNAGEFDPTVYRYATNWVNIIESSNTTMVALDGTIIPQSQFSQIGTSNYYYVQYPVAVGKHLVTGSNPIMVYAYGFLGADAYGFPASGASVHKNLVVPISLLSFAGEKQKNNTNLLFWTTLSEVNNNYFTIERSMDDFDYSALGKVNGAGNTGEQHDYSFIDHSPDDGVNYYRLMQTDFDGKKTYSNTISISNHSNNLILIISPVPVTDILKISLNTEEAGLADMRLYDILGNQLISQSCFAMQDGNQFNLNVSQLQAGVYFIIVSQNGQSVQQKVMKF